MFNYTSYQLRIRCDIPLPELVTDRFDVPDILIRAAPVGRPLAGTGERHVEFVGDDAYLLLHKFARFAIRDHALIEYELLPEADGRLLNFAIIGPVLALLLHLRGLFVLHGSAVSVAGKAAMFVGDKGAGKSTTIGAILSAGHPMLTDDVLALHTGGDTPGVVPGYPQIKLDDTAAGLFALPTHHLITSAIPHLDKLRIRFDDAFVAAPASAGAVYVLSRGAAPAARRMEAGEALTALLRFSYIARFNAAVLDGSRGAAHFAAAAAIAHRVGVYALQVPGDIGRIPEILPLIERHVAT